MQWHKNSTVGNLNAHQTDASTKEKGSTLQWNIDRGGMVGKRTRAPNKCFRTNGREIYNPDFHKKYLKFNYSYIE